MPETRRISAKWTVSIPSLSWRSNWMPEFCTNQDIKISFPTSWLLLNTCRSSTLSSAYMSSDRLNLKLNWNKLQSVRSLGLTIIQEALTCHVQTPSGVSPSLLKKVRPSWMIFRRSTLHLSSWKKMISYEIIRTSFVSVTHLILVVWCWLELSDGSRHDPRKLSVHGNIGEVCDNPANLLELILQVVCPHLGRSVCVVVKLLPQATSRILSSASVEWWPWPWLSPPSSKARSMCTIVHNTHSAIFHSYTPNIFGIEASLSKLIQGFIWLSNTSPYLSPVNYMFSLLVLRRGVSLQEVWGNQETGIKPILCEDSLGQFSQTNRSCVCVNKWNIF